TRKLPLAAEQHGVHGRDVAVGFASDDHVAVVIGVRRVAHRNQAQLGGSLREGDGFLIRAHWSPKRQAMPLAFALVVMGSPYEDARITGAADVRTEGAAGDDGDLLSLQCRGLLGSLARGVIELAQRAP